MRARIFLLISNLQFRYDMKKNIIIFCICIMTISTISIVKHYISTINCSYIFIFALLLFLCIYLSHTIKNLIISSDMFTKLNNSTLCTVRGTIFRVYGHAVHSADTTKRAYANYSFRGKSYSGKMICTYDRKINVDNSYTIYISEKYPDYFAMSQKHIKDTFLTYLTFTILLTISVALCATFGTLFIISSIKK